jgi:hypothetical protein
VYLCVILVCFFLLQRDDCGWWQALLQLLKATWACLAALNSEQPSMSLVTSCGFGGAAVVVGTFGNCALEKNSYLFMLLHFFPFLCMQ